LARMTNHQEMMWLGSRHFKIWGPHYIFRTNETMQFKFGMHKLIDHDEYSHAKQIPRMKTVRDHETSLNFSKYTVIHKNVAVHL